MIEGQFFEKFVPFRENEIYRKCFFKDINFWDIEIFMTFSETKSQ